MRLLLIFFMALFMGACTFTERTEALTAEITAAQMEGRRTAARIAATEWKDTARLQKALIEAKARQSQYLIDGKPECGEAYDSAFLSTMRTINPRLAKKLKGQ